MISGIKPKELLFRDGTSQLQRMDSALDPESVLVDERSFSDLIRFAQDYAKQLHFFDEENKPAGNWEGFLIDYYDTYKQLSSESERKKYRERWINDLLTYTGDPEKYSEEKEMLNRFGRPHLALFVTFLQLLGVIRNQLNGLTKRHLDYYYREVLGLQERKQVPDVVHVIIDLAADVQSYMLQKGTLLSAGKDASGKELVYTTEKEVFISHARINEIRTIFSDQVITGIRDAREANKTEPDAGLIPMLKLALGDPDPGDDLPYYKNKPADPLLIRGDLEKNDTLAQTYVTDQLFLKTQDFSFIAGLDVNSADEDWEEAYVLLDEAYKHKVTFLRQQQIGEIRQASAENGFLDMWEFALGDPDPHDELPSYNGETVTLKQLDQLYGQLTGKDAALYTQAANYVDESLFMKETDFRKCMEQYYLNLKDAQKAAAGWPAVYAIIERAQSEKRLFTPQSPTISAYRNIYAIGDSRSVGFSLNGEDSDSLRFKTFGKGVPAGFEEQVLPARIGFGIASPQLVLTEGKRTLSLGIVFENISDGKLLNKLKALEDPFRFYLSTADAWISVTPGSIQYGEEPAGNNQPKPCVRLDVELTLTENDESVESPGQLNILAGIGEETPVLFILLNNQELEVNRTIPYALLMDLKVKRISVTVQVEGLQKLQFQNDFSTLSYKKPFEPFGVRPEAGSKLYFTHRELIFKRLDSFSANLEWMNPPADLSMHYANYKIIAALDNTLPSDSKLIDANTSFTAQVSMKDNSMTLPLKKDSLFTETDARKTKILDVDLNETLTSTVPGFDYRMLPYQKEVNDILEYERYFSLELNNPDFQNNAYPILQTRQAYINPDLDNLKQKVLNPPYVPKLKSFTAGYTASFVIDLEHPETNETEHNLYHVHPFGMNKLAVHQGNGAPVALLPDYSNEGELYLGISGIVAPQTLSVLFQMAEGSADPDPEKPDISWDYLSENTWKSFPQENFPADTTNGLVDTGILEIIVPEDATDGNTLLNSALYWIRAKVVRNTTAIADTVDILSQASLAVFVDNNNDPDHLLQLLKPGSIKAPLVSDPQLKSITQPYTSSKGKPAESDVSFYNRVSERLRHKNRAVTMWDYERLVLDRFPEIHKVKCVPSDFSSPAESYGNVDVIVVPDIRGKLPFNPFQPKVPADTIVRVKQFLDQRKPAFASVKVKNPTFLQVKTRFAVKFHDNTNAGYFTRQLEDALKRYLAPWAYDDGADIVLGGKIYANMIVNFIAEQPYVDYVAGIKLFQSYDGKEFREARLVNGGENSVQAESPDVILVSAQVHEIDVVSEKGYEAEDFTGIDYMKIELDFTVS